MRLSRRLLPVLMCGIVGSVGTVPWAAAAAESAPGPGSSSNESSPGTVSRAAAPPKLTGGLPAVKDTRFAAPAGAVHASPNGRGVGTATAPASLANAVKKVPVGGTVVLASGIYRGELKFPKKFTLQPAPGGGPVWFMGSDIITGWKSESNRWCVGWNHNLTAAPYNKAEYIDPKFPLAARPEAVYVNGGALAQVGALGRVGPGEFAADIGARKLCMGDNPAGKTVEATTRMDGIVVTRKGAGSTIRGIGVAHYGRDGIQVNAAKTTVQDVTAVRNGISGVSLTSPAVGSVLRGSNLSYNGLRGAGASTDGMLVENNSVSFNNISGFRLAWAAAGIKYIKGKNPIFRNNFFAGNYSAGLWMDINTRFAIVVSNHFSGNASFGTFFELSFGLTYANNSMDKNGTGVGIANSSDAMIVNNSFHNNGNSTLIKDNPKRRMFGRSVPTKFVEIRNNAFVATQGGETKNHVTIQRTPCTAAPLVSAMNHNGFALTASADLGKFAPLNGACKTSNAAQPDTVAELAKVGLGGSSVTLGQEPFVNPAEGDLRLADKTPKGAPLQADVAKAVGVPGGKPVPLGVLTTTGGTTVPTTSQGGPTTSTPPSTPVKPETSGEPTASTSPSTTGTDGYSESPAAQEPDSSTPGGLALTGTSTILIIVGGVLLTAIGAVLVYLGRRRRTT